ncbi:glycosyl transferase [Epithele typhae]|uniref:glycosyl transferase n=1 Tax=Epithele typhae TaxID=378194 RepID=UPI0020086A62|nr:glycosyl transferase [Epithele typhae]KAH9942988.1 glycosyl transferase [Epithele typhae]
MSETTSNTDATAPPTCDYTFTETQDWFSGHKPSWLHYFRSVSSPTPRALEIGSWEGRSAVFTLTELCQPGSELVCIDHFDLMGTDAGQKRFRCLTHNLSLAAGTGKSFRIISEFSVPGLMRLLEEEMDAATPGFDWLYIDGSHEASDTFLDGELAWRLARKGAVMVFDDYGWGREPEDSVHHPKRGIDTFLTLHAGEYSLLSTEGQYSADKAKSGDLDAALGYGINVALVVDTVYAIGAAVAIRSAAKHTSKRITFYVLGYDLPGDVKAKLQLSVADCAHATMVFTDVPSAPSPEPGVPSGPLWAKVVRIASLPVERDGLRKLWDTDLEGKAIAAAPDVGFPAGVDKATSAPYFNAGVLLLNLTLVRGQVDDLVAAAKASASSKFLDQDALNAHFRGNWWAGTYARYQTPERATLDLAAMEDPGIVHFTGPLHPSMAEVLNPFVQPYGAKPWGYAGAPGHPYAEEWWGVCEETAWKGWRASEGYRAERERKREDAVREGARAFRARVGDDV